MSAQKITPLGAVIILIVLAWMWSDGAFDGVGGTIKNNAETVVNTVPDLVNAGQTFCNLDEIVLSEIKSNAIYDEMLLNTEGHTNDILVKWAMTERVETCEVVLLNELLDYDGNDKVYRSQLGIKNAMKDQLCTALQCFDEKGGISYLITDEYDGIKK
ncbi:MAG: hypothetical protein ACW9W4_06350 [Candidatus Nitrosopumilus sp. bin_7KS]